MRTYHRSPAIIHPETSFPPPRVRVHKKNISKMNFLGPPPLQCTAHYIIQGPPPPNHPGSLTLFVYIYIYKNTHTQPPAHTCCREILQNFNMIYPARVIYLSGFSYSVRAEIKLDSTGAVCRHVDRRWRVGVLATTRCAVRKLFSPAVLKNIARVGRVVRFVLSA